MTKDNIHSFIQAVYAYRLNPGDDLKTSLLAFAEKQNLRAAYIITCVGSLQKVNLRLAGALKSKEWHQKMEIVSLTGTLLNGGCHLHICLSDDTGQTIGGHLLDGCIVNTTVEVVIGEAIGLKFKREMDTATGYLELLVSKRAE